MWENNNLVPCYILMSRPNDRQLNFSPLEREFPFIPNSNLALSSRSTFLLRISVGHFLEDFHANVVVESL